MADYHVTMKVRNGRIFKAIEAQGYATVAMFCRATGISAGDVYGYLSFRKDPRFYKSPGRGHNRTVKVVGWKKSALQLAQAVGAQPEDLWPEHLMDTRENTFSQYVEAKALMGGTAPTALLEGPDDCKLIDRMVEQLPEKERYVVKALFFEGRSQRDLAEEAGTTTAAISSLLNRGLRRLKQQAGSVKIKHITDYMDKSRELFCTRCGEGSLQHIEPTQRQIHAVCPHCRETSILGPRDAVYHTRHVPKAGIRLGVLVARKDTYDGATELKDVLCPKLKNPYKATGGVYALQIVCRVLPDRHAMYEVVAVEREYIAYRE